VTDIKTLAAVLDRFATPLDMVQHANQVPLLNRVPRWTYYYDMEQGSLVLIADLLVTGDKVGAVPSVQNARAGKWWTTGKNIETTTALPGIVAEMHAALMKELLA
jgi:hypothetical protein